jgi:hypothetical protein
MKKFSVIMFIFVVFTALVLFGNTYSEEIKKEDCFFLSSQHYTTAGMAYWYDKNNGGLETLTGIPYSELDCKNCHISSCDVCHKADKDKKLSYSVKAAQNEEIGLHCHKREKMMMTMDKDAHQLDVHFAKNMQCKDCHTAKEVHGDGTEYTSMKQPGAMDTKCENCHESVPSSVSHKIHGNKLDCSSCHMRHVASCSNCHFDTLVKQGKRVFIPLSGWVFLMNYDGKVTSANMQTFVVSGNKTFLMFAPQNSHSVMKEGRKCNDCHANENVKNIQKGTLALTWLENGELKQTKGVIPVVEGVKYDSVYQDYKDGKWVPIENPPEPLLHYAGYGTPLTDAQLKKLVMPMGQR